MSNYAIKIRGRSIFRNIDSRKDKNGYSFGLCSVRGGFNRYFFRGSNAEEQKNIEYIRQKYAPFLYDENAPAPILDELGPIAEKLIAECNDDLEDILAMYEPIKK